MDISAGADEEAVGGQEDFVEDEEEQDVSALGPRAAEWIKAVDDAEIAENAAKAKEKGKGRAKAKAPESEAPAKDSRAPPKSGPVNLAKYAAVLDEVGEPLPMKMLAGAGALPFAFCWNGLGVAPGSDRRTTLTARCSRRDSVKNLAFR